MSDANERPTVTRQGRKLVHPDVKKRNLLPAADVFKLWKHLDANRAEYAALTSDEAAKRLTTVLGFRVTKFNAEGAAEQIDPPFDFAEPQPARPVGGTVPGDLPDNLGSRVCALERRAADAEKQLNGVVDRVDAADRVAAGAVIDGRQLAAVVAEQATTIDSLRETVKTLQAAQAITTSRLKHLETELGVKTDRDGHPLVNGRINAVGGK